MEQAQGHYESSTTPKELEGISSSASSR